MVRSLPLRITRMVFGSAHRIASESLMAGCNCRFISVIWSGPLLLGSSICVVMVALNPCTHSHSFMASLFLSNRSTTQLFYSKNSTAKTSINTMCNSADSTDKNISKSEHSAKSHMLQSDYVKWGVLSLLPPKLFQHDFISLETTTMLFPCLVLQWLQSATHGKFLWRNWDIQE